VTFDRLVTGKPLGGEVGGARVWRHSGDGAPHRVLQRVQAIGYHASRCLCVDRRVDAGKVTVVTQRHNGRINFLQAVWGRPLLPVRTGITGPWQLSGHNGLYYKRRIELNA
jgi:hypothetical protein